MSIIALIPARSGSKRVKGKNIRLLDGKPLIAYTIQAAKDAGIFKYIAVSTDDAVIGSIAESCGAMYLHRPEKYARDDSPDIEWITHALYPSDSDLFAILRPTSPFRTKETIKRAYERYDGGWMKAVEPAKQHPYKMWIPCLISMMPYLGEHSHASPTQTLPLIYVQNGSLEIRPCNDPEPKNYQPFFTRDYEGFDINTEDDFILAEALVERGVVKLPEVKP